MRSQWMTSLLKQIRIAPKIPDTIRIVLDLAEAHNYSVAELYDPVPYSVDLFRRGTPIETSAALNPASKCQIWARSCQNGTKEQCSFHGNTPKKPNRMKSVRKCSQRRQPPPMLLNAKPGRNRRVAITELRSAPRFRPPVIPPTKYPQNPADPRRSQCQRISVLRNSMLAAKLPCHRYRRPRTNHRRQGRFRQKTTAKHGSREKR